MKIGVDIRVLMDEHYSGISEYTANLLMAILRQNAALNESALSRPDDYRLFYNSFHDLGERLDKWNGEHSRIIGTRWPNKIFNYFLQKILGWPKIDEISGGVDIFWSPHFNFTRLSAGPKAPKKIITVHDLSFWRCPEFFSVRKKFWHRALNVKKILRAADKIVAISENTKNDIMELVGIAPEKISVIYPGNNASGKSKELNSGDVKETAQKNINEITVEDVKEFSLKHNLLEPFILYLGTIEPRKNIGGLIVAFNELRAKDAFNQASRFKNLQLVLAGAAGWKNKKIHTVWKNSPYKNDIKFLGYITQKDKKILYTQAVVFVYPSFYEGFGFPPLEAMTYGAPVVCSNVSSLPEVVGEAALMINPFKPEEITNSLEMILTDKNIRERLIAKGYDRAKLFSWDKTASEYLRLFRKLKN